MKLEALRERFQQEPEPPEPERFEPMSLEDVFWCEVMDTYLVSARADLVKMSPGAAGRRCEFVAGCDFDARCLRSAVVERGLRSRRSARFMKWVPCCLPHAEATERYRGPR